MTRWWDWWHSWVRTFKVATDHHLWNAEANKELERSVRLFFGLQHESLSEPEADEPATPPADEQPEPDSPDEPAPEQLMPEPDEPAAPEDMPKLNDQPSGRLLKTPDDDARLYALFEHAYARR